MRTFVIGLTLALTASGPLAATTQAPVTTQPLAANEVLLEVNALGLVTSPAERASLTFSISGTGETEAAARAAVGRNVAEIRALLAGQGVAAADIRIQPVTAYPEASMLGSNSMTYDVSDNMAEPVPVFTANAQAEVQVRTIARVAPIQTALADRGIFMWGGSATFALNDDSGPRRQARAQALQKARADAESYAVPLNLRVARVLRVTERLGLDLIGLAASESQMVGQFFATAGMRPTAEQVPTIVVVGVDFALAPR